MTASVRSSLALKTHMTPHCITQADTSRHYITLALQAFSEGSLTLRYFNDGRIKTLASKEEIAVLINGGFNICYNEELGRFYLMRGLRGGAPTLAQLELELETLPPTKTSVFISYHWDLKQVAKSIQEAFKEFYVVRDDDHLRPGSNLNDFMTIVKHPKLNYVIVIVSDAYLRSENCMVEAFYLTQRYKFEEALLSYVVTDDPKAKADIYGPDYQKYEKYWKDNLLTAQDSAKERIQMCLNACQVLVPHLRGQINAQESHLKKDGYQPFFTMINERKKGGAKFKEIDTMLLEAEAFEKGRNFNSAELKFKDAIDLLPQIYSIPGKDQQCAKAHNAYAAFLNRQNRRVEAIGQLTIAISFGHSSDQLFPMLKEVNFSDLNVMVQQVVINQVPHFSWAEYQTLSPSMQELINQVLTKDSAQIDPNMEIGLEEARTIAKAIQVTTVLNKCSLAHPNIHGEVLNIIATDGLQHSSSIRSLDLGANNLTPEDGTCIAALIRANTHISHLTLGRGKGSQLTKNKLGSIAVETISLALQSNKTLIELDFGDNGIDLLGIRELIKALDSNVSLGVLKLSNIVINEVVDEAERSSIVKALLSNTRIIRY